MSGNGEIHELDGYPVSQSLIRAEIDGTELPHSELDRTHTGRNKGSSASILSYDGFLAAEYENNPQAQEQPSAGEPSEAGETSYFFPQGKRTQIACDYC
jgi:hypothetical protein